MQNNLSLITTGFDPNVDYGPAQSDRRHVFNGIFNYELPSVRASLEQSERRLANKIIGGWYFSGIFRTYSSLPSSSYRQQPGLGWIVAGLAVGAIPSGDPRLLEAGVSRPA